MPTIKPGGFTPGFMPTSAVRNHDISFHDIRVNDIRINDRGIGLQSGTARLLWL